MIYAFISGLIAMGCWVIGLFFFDAWSNTRDRLFGIFAASFWILGFERVLPVIIQSTSERHILQYLVRLAAFLLLLYAIIDKNIGRTPKAEKDKSRE
jgi:zinc transporter ZupT